MSGPETDPRPLVVLIHGLVRSPASMLPLAWRLERRGWEVLRIGYASTRRDLAGCIAEVRARIPTGRPLHLVGHSLGGVISAALLRDPGGLDIRRVVQLGAPNLGSGAANRAAEYALIREIGGPVLEQLRRHRNTRDPDPRIGAVAGDVWPRLGSVPNDGVVSVRSAVSGAGDHVTVPVLHSLLPASAEVAERVDEFLAHGRFEKRSK